MSMSELKASDRPLLVEAPQLSQEEREAVQKRIEALSKLLAEEKKAKYKIEILFTSSRNLHGITTGIISLWESGRKFHGGGDAKIFICPGKQLGKNQCEGVIPDVGEGIGHLVCPACGLAWQGPEVIGEFICKFPMQKWVDIVLYFYVKLGHNADIYVKHAREDIRAAALAAPPKGKKDGKVAEKLTANRQKRVLYIYPLENIIKDTANGADLQKRFHSFLTA